MGELEARIARLQAEASLAVVFLDLNGFKTGERPLWPRHRGRIAQKRGPSLSKSIRESDHISRYGGDEFVILMKLRFLAVTRPKCWQNALERSLSDPFFLGETELFIGRQHRHCRVCPEDGLRVDELVGAADKHMYVAKRKGPLLRERHGPAPLGLKMTAEMGKACPNLEAR